MTFRSALCFIVIFSAAIVAGCLQDDAQVADQNTPIYGYKVIDIYPHDSQAFTQGLAYNHGFLYEGTGGYGGRSSLCQVELETGKVLKLRRLPNWYFGEGITLWNDQLIQLTWTSNLGLIWDLEGFNLTRTFKYYHEGWGITNDGKHLILSDGTSTLHILDPQSFQEIKQIKVQDKGAPISMLNELEFVKGLIYANVWKSDRISIISPETGDVLGWIDLSGLVSENCSSNEDVLNGIAYDAENDRLFVTGKLWPHIYQIEILI